MTKTPRTPPRPMGAPQAAEEELTAPPVEVAHEARSNPFASLGSLDGEGGGATKLYQVPRELIELARASAKSPASAGTLTPIAPRPSAELEATLAAYTAGLASISGRTSSSPPAPAAARQEVETLRSTVAASPGEPAAPHEKAGTAHHEAVLVRSSDAAPRAVERPLEGERRPLLRSPVASRGPLPPRSKAISAGAGAREWSWLFHVGWCSILAYCAYLLLSS